MVTLALDASTKCTGWSVMDVDSGKLLDSGVISLKNDKDSEHRIHIMTDQICALVKAVNPEKIYLEDTAKMANVSTLKSLCWLAGGVRYWCATHNYEIEMILPSVWRKYVKIQENGIKRNELKHRAINVCQQQFGILVSDDQAEAILINLAMAVRDYHVTLCVEKDIWDENQQGVPCFI